MLRADCVILDEFLTPHEWADLLQYAALAQEGAFQISEVIEPGASGGIIDYDHRRSRVLMDLGKHRETLVARVEACLPRVLARLDHSAFALTNVEAQITASNDGDYFRRHNDNAQGDDATREITFVYFLHREPARFRGGELRLYDSERSSDSERSGDSERTDEGYVALANHRTIVPRQNQMVFFASSLVHEITPVECSSRAFADSRFTVNGWLHR